MFETAHFLRISLSQFSVVVPLDLLKNDRKVIKCQPKPQEKSKIVTHLELKIELIYFSTSIIRQAAFDAARPTEVFLNPYISLPTPEIIPHMDLDDGSDEEDN